MSETKKEIDSSNKHKERKSRQGIFKKKNQLLDSYNHGRDIADKSYENFLSENSELLTKPL